MDTVSEPGAISDVSEPGAISDVSRAGAIPDVSGAGAIPDCLFSKRVLELIHKKYHRYGQKPELKEEMI